MATGSLFLSTAKPLKTSPKAPPPK